MMTVCLLHILDRRELLQNLPSVHTLKVGYDRIPECLPGTRIEVQADVLKLLRSTAPNQPSIVWINGVAGTGKSTVAATITHTLADSQNLGGSFFFSRNGEAEQVNSDLLFATLAHELALKFLGYHLGY
jgi:Mg-chelatase subunit ChlI